MAAAVFTSTRIIALEQQQELPQDISGAFCGIGPGLVAMSAEVSLEYIEGLGLELDQSYLAQEEHLRVFYELEEPSYECSGVGNVVRIVQWMTQRRGATSLIACLGRDEMAGIFEKQGEVAGVRMCCSRIDSSTGVSAVLRAQGKTTLVGELGAARQFDPKMLHDNALERARVVYLSGFMLAASMETVMIAAELAVRNAKVIMLSASADYLVGYCFKDFLRVMHYVDVLICNKKEALAFGRHFKLSSLRLVALKLASHAKMSGSRPRIVAVTQGPGPTIVAQAGHTEEFPVERLARDLIEDHMGQGDAFEAGFASKFLLGHSLAECVRAGHWASRRILQTVGVTLPKDCEFV